MLDMWSLPIDQSIRNIVWMVKILPILRGKKWDDRRLIAASENKYQNVRFIKLKGLLSSI